MGKYNSYTEIDNDELVISQSGKYKAVVYDKPDNTDIEGISLYKIIRIKDNSVIHMYTYKVFASPFAGFVIINHQEWWFGGRDHMLKLFVNCDTGEVLDDPNNDENSDAYKINNVFIWSSFIDISENGYYIIMNGCMLKGPYYNILYDIRDLKNGIKKCNNVKNGSKFEGNTLTLT